MNTLQTYLVEDLEQLKAAKERYMHTVTAPLDGMWLCGFVPQATHYGIRDGDDLAGYYCVNDDGYLLQFFLESASRHRSMEVFDSIIGGPPGSHARIAGAFVSSAEPHYASLCFDRFPRFEVNALMYQLDPGRPRSRSSSPSQASELKLVALRADQVSEAVDFAAQAIGAPRAWLNIYYDNLVRRGELFGWWFEGRLAATGERRAYDELQRGHADLGVIVAPAHRGKGVATWILAQLVAMNDAEGLTSICSTERDNRAAQKAIERAGFFAGHRILQFHRQSRG